MQIKTEKVPFWQRLLPFVLQAIAWYPGYLMLKVFLHLDDSQGKKHLKQAIEKARKGKRGLLFVSNHVSELDPIITNAALKPFTAKFPMYWVSKKGKSYKDPDFSWRRYIYGDLFFLAWGAQPLKDKRQNYEESLQRHSWLLKHGYSVCIFPEGGYEKKRQSLGGGAGFLMEAWNPVVVPVKIEGVKKITSKEFWGRKRNLKLIFGRAVEPKDVLDESLPIPERYKEAVKSVFL